jgi:uncharacterized protein
MKPAISCYISNLIEIGRCAKLNTNTFSGLYTVLNKPIFKCMVNFSGFRIYLGIVLGLCIFSLHVFGEDANAYDIKENYTKYEYRIPMRDGVKLFTAVYVPKKSRDPLPFLMIRTPYTVSPYGVSEYPERVGPSLSFMKAGYIFINQDVRGRGMSEGFFINETPHDESKHGPHDINESTDMYDSVEWLLKHVPNNNGRVGIWGISYPGFFVDASIIDSHPAIKAASPQAPMGDEYLGDDSYHNGALMLAANFSFFTGFRPQEGPTLPPKNRTAFNYGTQDGYEFYLKHGTLNELTALIGGNDQYWREVVDHTTYDSFWQTRAIWKHLKNIHCPVLVVGGLFDAEDLMGTYRTFQAIDTYNPTIQNSLVMGPWVHGGWARTNGHYLGIVDFASNTCAFYNESLLFPFFEYHLKDKGPYTFVKATVFETGTNVWRQYQSWPPKEAKEQRLYLRENGTLAFDNAGNLNASDSYVSDPAKPVPFVGYTALGMASEYMVSDQRFAWKRNDVLTYQTNILETDVTCVGPVSPKLFVSTTGTDSDFIVKLIDVYPSDMVSEEASLKPRTNDPQLPGVVLAGYQQLVRGEPFRGKFRKSFEHPEAFTPGKAEEISFCMPDINHTFRKGHRIMIQIQSTWFPLIDRNPQVFEDIREAKKEDFKSATETIYRGPKQPSSVGVFVMPKP